MAKPDITKLVWSTDANFTSGPKSGSPTKTEPGSGWKSQGFVPDDAFLGEYVNYWKNQVYAWGQYVDNLPSESSFLNANFVWQGAHEFSPSVEVLVSSGDLRVSLGSLYAPLGVFRAASSSATGIIVENSGQIRIDDGTVTSPVGYYGGVLQLSPCQMGSDQGNYDPVSSSLTLPIGSAGASVCLNGLLPKNAFIQDVTVDVTKGSVGAGTLLLVRRNRAAGTVTNVGSHVLSVSGAQTFNTGIMGGAERQMVDPSTYTWEVQYRPAVTDTDVVKNIRVSYRLSEIGKPS